MRSIILLIFTHLFLSGAPKIQGSYGYRYGESKESAYSILKVHYSATGKPLFYLEVVRAAPDYNSGTLYGDLTFNSKTHNYEYLPGDEGGCKLSFIKTENIITIKTLNGNCGFGHSVTADGNYVLKDKANPQYCETRTGKKVYFDKTPVSKFKED